MGSRASRLAVAAGGAVYAVTGAALLFAPRWFFENVGDFPPFNRHYAGDAGAFSLAIGLALLVAARRPATHAPVVALGALAALIHTANHAYDAARGDESLSDLLALVAFTALLVVAAVAARRQAS